jgi:YegS/Rv2252/BmrU family lipid kinase
MTANFKPGSKAFIIINPVAGSTEAKALKKVSEEQFHAAGWQTQVHMTKANEDLAKVINSEIAKGANLVVAAGGDGTVSAVAACMLHSHVPLGIIPTGTWNAIARYLVLPPTPQAAIDLMTGKHTTRKLDMMAVGKTIHVMNLGVGFSAAMIDGADRKEKRKLGNLAYLKHIIQTPFGLEMPRYIIEADGRIFKGRATEIFVANYGVVGLHFLEDGMNILPDDGKAEILILKARTLLDLPSLIWQVFVKPEKRTPKYRKVSASKKIIITAIPPALVQADGESLGQTPVTIKVLPRAVSVIAPYIPT